MFENEKEIFEVLNGLLSERGAEMEVICVGGFVLSHHGMRSTQDIDGFYETSALIDSIIFEVGERFGINGPDESWLNNSVQNLNKWPDKSICELLYTFTNLNVYLAPLDYVAGMKLESGREQDVVDVASIVKSQKVSDPHDLSESLKKYGFGEFDESLILEAFGKAYGMEWLEHYYVEHEEEILSNL